MTSRSAIRRKPRMPLGLSAEDRRSVEAFRGAGQRQARQVTRAHVLAALDDGLPEGLIATVLGIDRSTVWRIETACRQNGVEAVLSDAVRRGRPRRFPLAAADWVRRRFDESVDAGLPAPSLAQLQQAVRREFGRDSISRETVRRWLVADRAPEAASGSRSAARSDFCRNPEFVAD